MKHASSHRVKVAKERGKEGVGEVVVAVDVGSVDDEGRVYV